MINLNNLLKFDQLNIFETNASVLDCGYKEGFLLANIALGMRDKKTREILESYFKNIT